MYELKVTPDKIDESALTWYSDAKRLIIELYGENWKLFIGLLAATSPRVSVKRNWQMSDKILKAYLNRDENPAKLGDILGRLMPCHLINVLRVFQGRPIKGQKISRFYANLIGDLSVVTIDVWICKAFGIDRTQLTAKVYRTLEEKIVSMAERLGLHPANYQACIWRCIRRLSGKRPKSFVSVYRTIFCETSYFDFTKE